MPLFRTGTYRLASGAQSNFLIDCSTLTAADLDTLALQAVHTLLGFQFSGVDGVPRGGLPFAKALRKYAEPGGGRPRLLVDDVWTTGGSMRELYQAGDQGLVIFARGPLDGWCSALFEFKGRL